MWPPNEVSASRCRLSQPTLDKEQGPGAKDGKRADLPRRAVLRRPAGFTAPDRARPKDRRLSSLRLVGGRPGGGRVVPPGGRGPRYACRYNPQGPSLGVVAG